MTGDLPPDLSLDRRDGLPDPLRVLAAAYPREVWEGHDNFGEMVRFWLSRHAMFRDAIARLTRDAEAALDGGIDSGEYAPRLSRIGGFFLNELHMHHQVEDAHYFPQLVGLSPELAAGFDLLEADHQAIDGLLHEFAASANSVLSAEPAAMRDAVGALHGAMDRFGGLLERHLTDEEDLIVPVILKSGFQG